MADACPARLCAELPTSAVVYPRRVASCGLLRLRPLSEYGIVWGRWRDARVCRVCRGRSLLLRAGAGYNGFAGIHDGVHNAATFLEPLGDVVTQALSDHICPLPRQLPL